MFYKWDAKKKLEEAQAREAQMKLLTSTNKPKKNFHKLEELLANKKSATQYLSGDRKVQPEPSTGFFSTLREDT